MRRKIMLLHLIIASVITPAVLLVSISGGLYLLGYKGSVSSVELPLLQGTALNFKSGTLENDVRTLIKGAGIAHQFEYLKVRGNTIQTRPTSREYLEFKQGDSLSLTKNTPNLQKSLIELHKGHGPLNFKLYQKFFAVCLILVLLSGVYMGLVNRSLRAQTLVSFLFGLGVFVAMAYL